MASFRKRGELQWQARVARKGFPPQVKTFNSYAEAEAWASTVESAMAHGIFVNSAESERTTLREAFERYCREITVHKKSAAQEKSRIKILLAHPLALRSLSSLRGSDIAKYRDSRLETVGAQTVVHDLNLISNLFNIARKEWGMENLRNPVELVKKPKLPNGRSRRLEGDEEARLFTFWIHPKAHRLREMAAPKNSCRWTPVELLSSIPRHLMAPHAIPISKGIICMPKIATLLLFLFVAASANAKDVELRKCEKLYSHVEQRECLASLAGKVDSRLKLAEKRAIVKIDGWDEDDDYKSESKKLFLASTEAFEAYRTAQCGFIHSLAAGGNGATDMSLTCVVELSRQRIIQIDEYLTGLRQH